MGDEPVDPGRGRSLRRGGGIEQRREGEEHAGSGGEGAGERGRGVLERARRLGEQPELTALEPRSEVVDRRRAPQRGGQGELAEVPAHHLDPLEPPPHRAGTASASINRRIASCGGTADTTARVATTASDSLDSCLPTRWTRRLDPPAAASAAHPADREVAADPPAEADDRRLQRSTNALEPPRGRPKRRPCPAGVRQKTAPVPGYHGGRPENCDRNTASARMWGLRNHRSATSTAELRASSMMGRPARPSATLPSRCAAPSAPAGPASARPSGRGAFPTGRPAPSTPRRPRRRPRRSTARCPRPTPRWRSGRRPRRGATPPPSGTRSRDRDARARARRGSWSR